MVSKQLKILAFFCCLGFFANAQQNNYEQHVKVAMRMVGHQVLLSIGDSTSRVMPIEKVGSRYKVKFENSFEFNPDDLEKIVRQAVAETEIAERYIVEIEDCETNLIIYSYEAGNVTDPSIIPCRTREQPKACYTLFLTILESKKATATDLAGASNTSNIHNGEAKSNNYLLIILLLATTISAGVFVFLRNKKTEAATDPNTVAIGDYRFDNRKMQLSFEDETIELTSKECNLLQLLYDSANNTVERDTILKMVWDDEGDYVGRTLDVFISKLRKKLEADANVRIINVRGVGYKLVV